MEHVNRGLPEPYRVHWHNIVRTMPWLAAQEHLSKEELDRFYQEPGPEISSELEKATEDVYRRAVENAAQQETGNQPVSPSRADEAQTRNSPGVQLPEYEDAPDSQPQPAPSIPQDRPHKFEPGPNWTKITGSKTSLGAQGAQPGATTSDSLDKELGKDNVTDILGDYMGTY